MSTFDCFIKDINFAISLCKQNAFTDASKYIGNCFNYLDSDLCVLSNSEYKTIESRTNDCAIEIIGKLNFNDFNFKYIGFYNHLQKLQNSSDLHGEERNLSLGIYADLKSLEKFSIRMNINMDLKPVKIDILLDIFSSQDSLKAEEKYILKNNPLYISVYEY